MKDAKCAGCGETWGSHLEGTNACRNGSGVFVAQRCTACETRLVDGKCPICPPVESAKCGEVVTHLIAGASWFPCALEKGHDGGHRAAGHCNAHGDYFGEPGAVPQCPQWPTCITELLKQQREGSRSGVESAPPDHYNIGVKPCAHPTLRGTKQKDEPTWRYSCQDCGVEFSPADRSGVESVGETHRNCVLYGSQPAAGDALRDAPPWTPHQPIESRRAADIMELEARTVSLEAQLAATQVQLQSAEALQGHLSRLACERKQQVDDLEGKVLQLRGSHAAAEDALQKLATERTRNAKLVEALKTIDGVALLSGGGHAAANPPMHNIHDIATKALEGKC